MQIAITMAPRRAKLVRRDSLGRLLNHVRNGVFSIGSSAKYGLGPRGGGWKRVALAISLASILSALSAQVQPYDALVAHAKADLDAGDLLFALEAATTAIKVAPTRWEAYLIAGAVRTKYGECIYAAALLDKASRAAPEAKKQDIERLEQKCIEQGSPQPLGASNTANAP